MNDVYNYWLEKIALKKQIEKELMPKLNKYIGSSFNDSIVSEIRDEVVEWMSSSQYHTFDYEIKIEMGSRNGRDIVKNIKVCPIEV